jgi:hypothetical protein
MGECKKNVGRGVVSYPCNLEPLHEGPCVARENQPSINARKQWLLDQELVPTEPSAIPSDDLARLLAKQIDQELESQRRPLPHPGAEPLSVFQGKPKNSQVGMMEYAQNEGAPLTTTDTNRPGEAQILYTKQPDGTFRPSHVRQDSLEVELNEAQVATVAVTDRAVEDAVGFAGPEPVDPTPVPTKQRPGDQPLPTVNDTIFIQDLVVEDIEARKKVGIQRYGSALQAFNGRNVDQDLYEELVDATMYLRQALVERVQIREIFEDLVYNVQVTLGDIPSTWQASIDKIRSGL